MARYGLPSDRAYGVAMRDVQTLAKRLGRNHDLAAALWSTGWYEARLLAAYVDDPGRLTPAQMDRWCRDFDNWGLCDTVCFVLFDKTPHAWTMVKRWAGRRGEFTKRAAFALLWGLSVHDKKAADRAFVEGLVLIERAADDDRHFVKKGVNMALRAVGKRSATSSCSRREGCDAAGDLIPGIRSVDWKRRAPRARQPLGGPADCQAFVTERTPHDSTSPTPDPLIAHTMAASALRDFRRHGPSTVDTEAVAEPLHCDIHRRGFGLLQLPVQRRLHRNAPPRARTYLQ